VCPGCVGLQVLDTESRGLVHGVLMSTAAISVTTGAEPRDCTVLHPDAVPKLPSVDQVRARRPQQPDQQNQASRVQSEEQQHQAFVSEEAYTRWSVFDSHGL
jgi:hypothetical protein